MCSIGLGLATVLMTARVMPKHLKPAMLVTLAPLPVPPIRVREIDLLIQAFTMVMSRQVEEIWDGLILKPIPIANANTIVLLATPGMATHANPTLTL